jgi:phage terminase large subunit
MSTIFCKTRGKKIKFRPQIKLNPKQDLFFRANTKHVAYGGARGGGKSWALRILFAVLCVKYTGLKVLLLRKTFPELLANHILPLKQELKGIAYYKASEKMFIFENGSILKLGYCDTDGDADQYQGQEYDAIGFEEATKFSEYVMRTIGACLRSPRPDFRSRIYYSCNPGGVSHHYIKRLFIDREFEGPEKPEEYTFIPALVWDNKIIVENDPDYIEQLNNLPEDMVAAHRDGDWDALSGAYFKEFKKAIHVIEPFVIPDHWYIYFVMDYGLDCLAGYWIADDHKGNYYVILEVWEPDHIISSAAKRILELNDNRTVEYWYAPPDMKMRRQDTGKTALEIFSENGIDFITTKNDRIEGWLAVKEMLKVRETRDTHTGEVVKTASLKIFSNCVKLIKHIPVLQRDEKNPNDVATKPHEFTHATDAIRYWCSEYTKSYSEPKEPISGTWARGELRMKGYSDAQINKFISEGLIKLVGR